MKVRNAAFASLVTSTVLWASAASADPVARGNNFVVNASVASCAANAECKIDLRLEAQGEFHVNKEYPYKFKMAAAPSGVTYLGKDPGGVDLFSKAAGDFSLDASNEKVGTMTIRFKSSNRGSVSIAGVFKLSVCSAQNCMLEQAQVSVPVTVR
jgi:hypothetical protein